MTQIFISYRRADSQAIADRIHDHMAREFGADNVFQDVEDIPPGADFREYLAHAVASSDVLLVIIGKRWLDITDEMGKRRLDDATDFVRIEVETGLNRDNVLVIPVMVDATTMPSVKSLPPTLRALTYRNGVIVRHNPYFDHDIERLIARIKERFTRKKTFPWLPIALVFFSLMAIISIILIGAALSDNDNDTTSQESTKDTRPAPNITFNRPTNTTGLIASPTQQPSPSTTNSPQVLTEPTILYPDGSPFELFYNATSFYIWNPNLSRYSVSSIVFQAINNDNELLNDPFEGSSWSIFYAYLESDNCYRIEITRLDNYLRPDNCRNYNAVLTQSPNDSQSFWIPRENVTHFAVFWNNEEIARCLIEAGACEIFIPN